MTDAIAIRSSAASDFNRDDVIDALALASHTDAPDEPPSRERTLLQLMIDPSLKDEPLPALMKRAGILLPEMLEMLRRKDIAVALMQSAHHMGEVVDGLGEFAKPRWLICKVCDGEGEIEDDGAGPADDPDEGEDQIVATKDCPNPECKDGKVRQMGNLDAAKLFLDVHGLKRGGASAPSTVVNVSAQAGVRMGDDKPKQESITTKVQQILEG